MLADMPHSMYPKDLAILAEPIGSTNAIFCSSLVMDSATQTTPMKLSPTLTTNSSQRLPPISMQ
jgi:hypothetical protein